MPRVVILTVTLNLALDVTYRVEQVAWHAPNRVSDVAQRAGGKGVNVARILRAVGHEPVVAGLVGGPNGAAVRADLKASGLVDELVAVTGETRRTVAVVDAARGDATGFWEPGPTIAPGEWKRFDDAYAALLRDADAVVLAGSLPPGAPADAYARLCRLAARAGVPAVLDADGDALRLGVGGGPAIVKPNADELRRVAAHDEPEQAAEALREAGADAVVVSRGPDGLLAVTGQGRWRVQPPERVVGNPTGAGDAVVAALTAGLVTGLPWPDRLADATALAAASVAAPLAGCFDADAYHRYRANPRAREVTSPPVT